MCRTPNIKGCSVILKITCSPGVRANWRMRRENGLPKTAARGFTRGKSARWNCVRNYIAGNEFSSRQLYDSFSGAQAHSAVLVAVSAGKECEQMAQQFWRDSKPDEYFFMEIFGSAVVEHLVTVANGRICGWADANAMVALPHYSPGYSGWDIADQIKLWNLIRKNNGGGFPGELDVLESGMLRPKKSLLAVVGVTRDLEKARRFAKLIPCENCSLPGCQYRRAPYFHAPQQIEDIRRLQNFQNDDEATAPKSFALARNAKYSVNVRALQKWSQERLRLNSLPGGSVEAQFRLRRHDLLEHGSRAGI